VVADSLEEPPSAGGSFNFGEGKGGCCESKLMKFFNISNQSNWSRQNSRAHKAEESHEAFNTH
jgi:hypothetical protein